MFMNLSALQLFAWLSTDDYIMPGAFRVYIVSVYLCLCWWNPTRGCGVQIDFSGTSPSILAV